MADKIYLVGEEVTSSDYNSFETYFPILHPEGHEIARVGYQRWCFGSCSGFEGTDDQRLQLAQEICDMLNSQLNLRSKK